MRNVRRHLPIYGKWLVQARFYAYEQASTHMWDSLGLVPTIFHYSKVHSMAERNIQLCGRLYLLLGLQESQYWWHLLGKATCTYQTWQSPSSNTRWFVTLLNTRFLQDRCWRNTWVHIPTNPPKNFTPLLCISSNGVRWKISQRYGHVLLKATFFLAFKSHNKFVAFTGKSHTHTHMHQTWHYLQTPGGS